MLNVLYQNKVLNPKLRMKEQPGTKADLAPNLRGDLNPEVCAALYISRVVLNAVLIRVAMLEPFEIKGE